ncbi:hypothetical protein ACLIJJ_21690 [Niallia sp. BSM11]
MVSLWSKRQSLAERYRNNTSKYTKANKIMEFLLIIIIAVIVVSLFADNNSFVNSFVMDILIYPVYWILYTIIAILDIRGRLDNDRRINKGN